MELVNTGRRVQNPLQHKGFRRFQSCRHRPQQTRKCQVRTRLEISAEAGNFVPLILLDIPQHRKSQNRIFFAVSPVFSPTNFRAISWKKARMKIDTESCPSGRRCSTRNAVCRKAPRVRIPNSPPDRGKRLLASVFLYPVSSRSSSPVGNSDKSAALWNSPLFSRLADRCTDSDTSRCA